MRFLDRLIKWAERQQADRELPPGWYRHVADWWRQVAAYAARSVPNDIRAAGWSLVVHYDFKRDGDPWTSWVFIKDGRAVTGKGRTDAEALDLVREQISE